MLPPKIIEFNNVTAIEGSIAQIVCKTSGSPVPQVSLDFLGEESDDQRYVSFLLLQLESFFLIA